MSKIIAKRYSKALFNLALEQDIVDEIYDDCRGVAEFLDKEQSALQFLASPNVTKEKKSQLITKSFEGKVNEHTLNFMKLLITKGRTEYLTKCCHLYIKSVEEHKGIIKANIQTAQKLNDSQLDSAKAKISSITGKEVLLSSEVQEDLIGGMVIKIGNKIIDGSVKNRLKLIEQSLKNVQIK
ncbi:F0F1 ATP synthase subunit delta [Proteinivorax hydrogeniformans]|uniref:ATP synthase subunit delta n=1 Tax=Proteinivorax hydrogeniformans TaxID=1826727 RepID=A0AAU8HST0_9FIRM